MKTASWPNIKKFESTDANVQKFVFATKGAVAEAVLYKYPTYQDRTVICCSTQSGCPVGCRFCGAGDKFIRSLTTEEIVEQPSFLLDQTGVDPTTMGRLQIMFMSMGEPMLNLKALIPALRELHRRYPNAALLISTSAPDVDYQPLIDLSAEIPTIGLQFSVHESTDAARNLLVPFQHKLTLEGISKRGHEWALATGRQPFFNYCAHPANTSDADADRLEVLYPPHIWQATLSVICERGEHIAAANERQRELASNFSSAMLSRGYSVRVFNPAGQDDIGGGCGQLWFVQEWMRQNPGVARSSCGDGLAQVHAPS